MSDIDAKYSLTRDQVIFLAKRNLAEHIYNSAKLEGCNVSIVETQTILNGINVEHIPIDVIQRILNLRRAWNYVLASFTDAFDLEYVCEINTLVFRDEHLGGGKLRARKAKLPGTNFVPPIPVREDVDAEILRIMNIESVTRRAITFFLWTCRARLFPDGNKRTGMFCANKMLIEAGAGILTVKDALVPEFNKRLKQFFETGDMSVIDQWLYEHCIVGINL